MEPFATLQIAHFDATAHLKDRAGKRRAKEKRRRISPITSSSSSSKMELDIPTDDDLTISDKIDEDGFPIAPLLSEVDGDGGGSGDRAPPIAEITGGFALDFYSSGADWSCLREEEKVEAGKESRSLVQRNLFQMWGIKEEEVEVGKERRSLVQRDLFQMWGIKLDESRPRVPSPPCKKRPRMAGGGSGGDRADWKERKGADSGYDRPRVCPFYKKISGTPFTVDAFRYGPIEGCTAYFLTHFHSDHYGGLSKRWSHGPIYCTPLTACLVKMCLSVNPLYVYPLELDTEHVIEGIKVTMLEANHCPGAALIHFRLRDGRCYLHTGDFRACKLMQSYPLLISHRINVLYLDTTYCNPKYRFPSKEDVVSFIVRTTRTYLAKQTKTLVVVGAYSIGKEHVYIAISQALGIPIYTNASRRRILQSFGWPELSGKLCSCGQSSSLHVLPLSFLRPESLKEYLNTYKQQFTAVLAFRPTGWTYSESSGNQLDLIRPNSKGNITIYGVPYSEHSSFTELGEFVKFLKPEKIIPTVNIGNAASRDKMGSYFREWLKH